MKVILTRIGLALLMLWCVSIVVFIATEIAPGDAATRILKNNATAANIEMLREQLHLNRPALVRYTEWLGRAVRGDFGASLITGRRVADVLLPRIANTLLLTGAALLLYIPLSVGIALVQAVKRDSLLDQALSAITLLLVSIPDFLLATILLLLLGVYIPLFPVSSTVLPTDGAREWLLALGLPAITLAIAMSVYAVRMMREGLIEVFNSDYIRTAELKGLSRAKVLLWHALPNALIPTLSVTALNIGYMVGSVVIVEKVFGFPGFGTLMVDSFHLMDVPVLQSTVLLAAAIYVAANLAADLGALAINPRLRQAA